MENTNSGMKKYLFGFLIVIVGFFVWRYISNPLVVTVTGTGKVAVPATSARLTANVVVTGDSVDQVVADLNSKVAAVRLAMVTGNMNEKNITQAQVQVTPLAAVVSGAKGYSATVTLFGQTSDVTTVTNLVTKLYKAGASIVSQPTIEVSNSSELENTALKQALDEAKVNAKYVGRLNRKYLKSKAVSIQQASSGSIATATKTEASDKGSTSSFEVAKAVSVTYWMW